ncbi:MAG: hypothetical protein VX699_11355 [Myxococcota bacterium]|nr:hypothetical protein [Myxococcota bacterium]
MKLTASLRLVFFLAVVLTGGCDQSAATGIRLDLSPLVQQGLQSAGRVDHINLSVEAPDSPFKLNQTLAPNETDVELKIPANTPLSLIVQARSRIEEGDRTEDEPLQQAATLSEAEGRTEEEVITSYFGATKFVARPGTISDVDLKVRPAGKVTVSFTFPKRLLNDNARPDADTSRVSFRSTDTLPMIPDAHNERLVRWQSNRLTLSQTLHVGTYELSGVLVINRVEYILPRSEPLSIPHGGVLSLGEIKISCEDPNADEDQDGHTCPNDCDDSEKRCWLPHHCEDSDGDQEINCLDTEFRNTGAPIPSTCGNGVRDAGERCDGDCPLSAEDCPSNTGCTTFTFSGHAATCSSRCKETPVTCGQGQSCDDTLGGCVCQPDHEAAGDICIHEKQVNCRDNSPEHAIANVIPVTITYSTEEGWSSPAPCLWECAPGYLREEQRCINSRESSCNNVAPENANSIPRVVTITYLGDGQWSSPADCLWECAPDYFQSEQRCINTQQINCQDVAPENATSTPRTVSITYSNGEWSPPEACAWTCDNTSDCVINNACISKGTKDPTNPCRSCQSSINGSAYSPSPGQACGDSACTPSQCNLMGECEAGESLTCAAGLTCSEEVGGCACAPNTSQCVNDDTGALTALRLCEASGTQTRVNTCDFVCLNLSETSALCLKNQQVTGLTITANGDTLVLHWDALVPQTQSLKYQIQTRNTAGTWENLATTSTNSYSQGNVSGGVHWYRVRGVEAGQPMSASNAVSINLSPGFSTSTGSTSFLYLFPTAGTHNGNLGNREETNYLCSSELTLQDGAAACEHTVALLSMSDSDSIANLPATNNLSRESPIKSLNGTILAYNWPDFIDGDIQSALLEANINAPTWWSGSDHLGNNKDNCNRWTSSSGNATGRYGAGTTTDQDWISKGSSSCNQERHVLCLCVPSSQAD